MNHIGCAVALLAVSTVGLCGQDGQSMVESAVKQRLSGDLSGACVAVARISGIGSDAGDDIVEQAFVCADDDNRRTLHADTRFEIGSITKAMQGIVVAGLVEAGELDLDEPVAELLPEGVTVPSRDGKPILVRHLLTHSSGLPRMPAGLSMDDPANPYASVTAEEVLGLLEDTSLGHAPGEAFAYSNFGAMLLSIGLAHRTGQPVDRLMEQVLFEPLGMTGASIDGPVVQGHNEMGLPVVPWDFPAPVAGVGGVRATLAEMITFARAILAPSDDTLGLAMRRAGEELASPSGQSMGWGWVRLPLDDHYVLFHNGGTGGATAELVLDPTTGRGVVVLSDTALHAFGGLTDLALHLLDDRLPLGEPRTQ